MFWNRRSSRMDRVEIDLAALTEQVKFLAEISVATNRRIDRFVEATDAQLQTIRAQTAQLQQAVEYILNKRRVRHSFCLTNLYPTTASAPP